MPEKREEVTTEGGLDVVRHAARVGEVVKRLKGEGILLSAFIEPVKGQIEKSAELGFDAIELWTGAFAHAKGDEAIKEALGVLNDGVKTGHAFGLEVHGGHGLTYRNVAAVAAVPGFSEFNIGHSIIARAVFVGLRAAVREMKDILDRFNP